MSLLSESDGCICGSTEAGELDIQQPHDEWCPATDDGSPAEAGP